MAGDYGTLTSLGDTDPMRRQVLDVFPTLDPKMHVLLNLLSQGEPVTGISGKLEWMQKNVHLRSGTISGTWEAASTTESVASGEGNSLGVGDIILVESEYIQVTAVSTDSLTIRRGVMGSSDVEHLTGVAWEKITNAQDETATITARGYLDATAYYNWIQTFLYSYEETYVAQAMDNYGGTTKLQDMIIDALVSCRADLNKQIYRGVRAQFTSGSVSGVMGGLKTFVSRGNSDTAYSSDPVSELFINTAFEDIITAAGNRLMPTTIMCTYPMKQAVAKVYAALNSFNRNGSDRVAGINIDTIHTPYGDIELVADPDVQTGYLYFLRLPDIKIHAVQGMEWKQEEKPISKLATQKNLFGAYTMSVVNPKSMLYLQGLSEAYS